MTNTRSFDRSEVILDIHGLKTYFFTDYGIVKAVDGIDLEIRRGETLGVVGESGSGKTVTALSIMGLVQFPGRMVEGEILFNGENLMEKSEEELRRIRGKKISMIFQDPMTSLNPVLTIGSQVADVLKAHDHLDKSKIEKLSIDMLNKVGITDAALRLHDYPHRLSGGMRQRVMIASALLCSPALLIADEPTTNLDVTIQRQVLELMKDLKKDFSSSVMLITHDLGIVAETSDRVAIMYAGRVMEYSDVETIFAAPMHPYTAALLESIPRLDVDKKRLNVIPGAVPRLIALPTGCRFHPRCKYAVQTCSEQEPRSLEIERGHFVACLRAEELMKRCLK